MNKSKKLLEAFAILKEIFHLDLDFIASAEHALIARIFKKRLDENCETIDKVLHGTDGKYQSIEYLSNVAKAFMIARSCDEIVKKVRRENSKIRKAARILDIKIPRLEKPKRLSYSAN